MKTRLDRTTVARFTLPVDQFPLGAVLERWPDGRVELDRVVPSAGTTMPYFWVYDVDVQAVPPLLERRPQFDAVTVTDDMGDHGLLRAEWSADSLDVLHSILESDVTMLSAAGTDDGWVFELRASSRDAIAGFMERCRDLDVPASMTRVRDISRPSSGPVQALTDEQREAMLLAFSAGYYEEPRRTDLSSLAERVGISRQAFASRLRRGYRNLVVAALVDG